MSKNNSLCDEVLMNLVIMWLAIAIYAEATDAARS